MKDYFKENIKNIAVFGHMGGGKTTLVESFAYVTKQISKKGDIDKKTTISDYTVEEQNHKFSISASLVPVEHNDCKINFIDLPGLNEFVSDSVYSLPACSAALLVIDATKGVDVATVRAWKTIKKAGLPVFIVINKMDKENVSYDNILAQIKEKLGNNCIPFMYPMGTKDNLTGFANVVEKTARFFKGDGIVNGEIDPDKVGKIDELYDALIEEVAQSSEELLEKFFSGEELTREEVIAGLKAGVHGDELFPIMLVAGIKDLGVKVLLDMIVDLLPAMDEVKGLNAVDADDKEIKVSIDEKAPFSGYVFKTVYDPFIGTMSFILVATGVVKTGQEVTVNGKTEKIGQLLRLMGKTQTQIDSANAGDICCVAKMGSLSNGSTLSDKSVSYSFIKPELPKATLFKAINPKNKQDEDKMSQSLQRLALEDESFEIVRNKETKQQLLGGQGSIHIDVIIEKLKNMFRVEVSTDKQKIVYRETIRTKAQAPGRYIKQSGGSGYYGVVEMSFEPVEGDSIFTEEIFGGTVPRNYFPAVEKGFFEALETGPLAGFPVINVKATLLDGKYHPVDSNELAFKNAAKLAFKEACSKAKKIILEPIMHVDIKISDEYLGDILGDINKRRGRVLGMNPEEGYQVVSCEVPEAEIISYNLDLKAMTQGDGTFTREFVRYEEVPATIAEKIIADAKVEEEK